MYLGVEIEYGPIATREAAEVMETKGLKHTTARNTSSVCFKGISRARHYPEELIAWLKL